MPYNRCRNNCGPVCYGGYDYGCGRGGCLGALIPAAILAAVVFGGRRWC